MTQTEQMLADIARDRSNNNVKLSIQLRATILLMAKRGELSEQMLQLLGLMPLPPITESQTESKKDDFLEALLGGNNATTSNSSSNS